MNQIENVLHPTDFSAGSLVAFHHALKATLLSKSKLTLLGIGSEDDTEWEDFPAVRQTLELWELLPKGSVRADVAKLGINASKIISRYDDPVEAVVRYLEIHHVDLIVLATHQHDGRVSWMGKSVAQPVARRAAEMTLFIPDNCEGFVSAADGSVSLKRVLIPVADSPKPQPAIDAVCRLINGLSCPQGTFTLMHVGKQGTLPRIRQREVPGWDWQTNFRSGDVIQNIVDAANEIDADLVAMATDGRSGFLEGLRGSHSERVLKDIGIPLLIVPVAADSD